MDESTTDQDTTEPAAPEGMRYLFSLNGKDYFVKERFGPNVGIAYLRDVRRRGSEYAVAALMDKVLGEETMDDLADADDLTEEQWDAVVQAVQKVALGSTEASRGKSSGARRS